MRIMALALSDNDVMEIDHIIPKSKGGSNHLQLLHGHCHDLKHGRKPRHVLELKTSRPYSIDAPGAEHVQGLF